MKILAFDTSSASGSVALVDDDVLVAEWTSSSVAAHAVWLLPRIDGLLKSVNLGIRDMDLFAVANGPGSFTGLRIGVSVAKGLAWSLRKRVVGVSTLDALAMNFMYAGMPVCTALDARRGELYAAIYEFDGGSLRTIMARSAVTPEGLSASIAGLGIKTPILFAGSGLNAYADYIKTNVKNAVFAPEPLWHIRASNVALAAFEITRAKEAEEPFDPAMLPLVYLRKG
ncbi:MAG: tRNA (adenosine(37)-N6)-threonylcarbamoyltransferase complex dimerization subunit type 1 TsaB [Deltaproteobacteria bacterium]|nr:tRNA (adenosine(37)-N6)-threonylcarbamoyltransferase complex dimerization subunit type 1 TsaB [Deltaproteobacteria bacterium]